MGMEREKEAAKAARKSIRASLPHSRFISSSNVKRPQTHKCHYLKGAERSERRLAKLGRKWRNGETPRPQTENARSTPKYSREREKHLQIHCVYRSISNETIVNAAQTAAE